MRFTEEKLTYLLFIYQNQNCEYSLTSMANKLGISKSTVSKVYRIFYEEGILLKKGKGQLSPKGCLLAKQFIDQIHKISKWLMKQATLDYQEAYQEAMRLVLYMSTSTKAKLLQQDELTNFFYKLEGIKKIHGDMLCAHLGDGEYPFAFTLYDNQPIDMFKISIFNNAFLHPGILKIEKGKGNLILYACEKEIEIMQGKMIMKAKIKDVNYWKHTDFVSTQQVKDSFLLPTSNFSFYYDDQEQLLQTHIKIQVKLDTRCVDVPKTTAILSILFK